MEFWLIMGALFLIACILLVIIIVTLRSGRTDSKKRRNHRRNDDLDEEEPQRPKRQNQAANQTDSQRKQWKVVLENLDTWEKVSFIFYDNLGIGRSQDQSDFETYLSVEDDPRVSKLHCMIVRKGDRLYLRDLGAKNGTYLNGKKVVNPVQIQKDDVIGLGNTRIEIQNVLRER